MFLAFAFWGISNLLQKKTQIQIDKFPSDLQEDVDSIYQSSPGSQEETYSLPKKVDEICFFKGSSNENLKIIEETDEFDRVLKRAKIEHLDINKIVINEEYCIKNTAQKIELVLEKEEGNPQVIIN